MQTVSDVNSVGQILQSLALAIAFFSLLLFSGASIWKMIFPRFTYFEIAVFGFVTSLAMLGLGGWLSLETKIFWIRFLPIGAAFVLSLLKFRNTWLNIESEGRGSRTTVRGIVFGLVAGLPVLYSNLKSQSLSWSGWKVFYPDLDFQAALVGEAGYRTPEFFPYVVGTNLDYHWLFHSTWGIISWAINLSPTFSTFIAWPVAIWLLMPIVIGLATFRISRSERAALIAPVMFMISTEMMSWGLPLGAQGGINSNSPTRDLAAIYFATILVVLVEAIRNRDQLAKVRYLAVLGLLAFVGSGTKGPFSVVLAGAFGIWMLLEKQVKWGRDFFLTLAIFGALSILLVIGDSGKLILGLFATYAREPFYGVLIEKYSLLAVGSLILISTLLTLLPMIFLRSKLEDSKSKSIATFLLLTPLIALFASKSLDYYGSSQEYFWKVAAPATVVGISWSFAVLTENISTARSITALAIPVTFSTLFSVLKSGEQLDEFRFGLIFFALPILASLLFLFILMGRNLEFGKSPFIYLFGSFIVMHSVIPLAPSVIGQAKSSSYGAIHSDARSAALWLKKQSNLDKLFITNQHCRGTTKDGACDARMFFVTAWSGKRSLVEGWAYTPEMAAEYYVGGLNKSQQEQSRQVVTGDIIDPTNLVLADSFINNPTSQTCIDIQKKNAQWVYIDKRMQYSQRIIEFSNLAFDSTWASIYELNCNID